MGKNCSIYCTTLSTRAPENTVHIPSESGIPGTQRLDNIKADVTPHHCGFPEWYGADNVSMEILVAEAGAGG